MGPLKKTYLRIFGLHQADTDCRRISTRCRYSQFMFGYIYIYILYIDTSDTTVYKFADEVTMICVRL